MQAMGKGWAERRRKCFLPSELLHEVGGALWPGRTGGGTGAMEPSVLTEALPVWTVCLQLLIHSTRTSSCSCPYSTEMGCSSALWWAEQSVGCSPCLTSVWYRLAMAGLCLRLGSAVPAQFICALYSSGACCQIHNPLQGCLIHGVTRGTQIKTHKKYMIIVERLRNCD